MDQQRKNKEFIINYLTDISGVVKSRALAEKYMTDEILINQIEYFDAAFPAYEVFIHEILAEGNFVMVRARFRGTHKGDLAGIPATQKTVEYNFVIRYELENGKIKDHWLIADQMGLMEQLGVLPAATTTH